MKNPSTKIAVIGAGPMGLAVAYQLSQDGYSPVIFEADDRIGGMTACFNFGDTDIERFYHFHCTSDTDFLEMLNELDLASKMQWVATKMGYWHKNMLQEWGNPISLLKFKGLKLSAKLRYGIHAFYSTKKTNWQILDSQRAIPWIQRWVGKEAYSILWEKLFKLKFYEYSTDLSAAWIWSRIRRLGNSRYNLFQEKLGYLEGGSSTLLQALREAIENNGGVFRLKTPIRKAEIDNGRIVGLKTDNGIERFDKVISTVPLPYIPTIFSDLPPHLLEGYRSVKNIAVVCVIAKLKKQVSNKFWVNTNDPEMDIPGLVEYTNLRPLNHHIVYAPFYMPAENVKFKDDNGVFSKKLVRYIKKINPTIRDDDVVDVHVSRYRYAQPICDPGFLEKLPPAKSQIQGLWIADTSYYYPEDRGISESIGFGRRMAKEAIL